MLSHPWVTLTFLDSVTIEMSNELIRFPSLSSRSPDKYEEIFTAIVSTFIMTRDIQNAA